MTKEATIHVLTTEEPKLSRGALLRLELAFRGMDQAELADQIGITRQTVNNVIHDRVTEISRATARGLADVLGRSEELWMQNVIPLDNKDAVFRFIHRNAGLVQSKSKSISRDLDHEGTLVDFEIRASIESGEVAITPFTDSNVEPASIDLTLDELVIDSSGAERRMGGKPFPLQRFETVNLQTREKIRLSSKMLGRVGSLTETARFGLIITHGFQIDPGYEGHLQFCAFNAGPQTINLDFKQKILSVELRSLKNPPLSPYAGTDSGHIDKRHEVSDFFKPRVADQYIVGKIVEQFCPRVRLELSTIGKNRYFVPEIEPLTIQLDDDNPEAALFEAYARKAWAITQSNGSIPDSLQSFKSKFKSFCSTLSFSEKDMRRLLAVADCKSEPSGMIIFGGESRYAHILGHENLLADIADQLALDVLDLIFPLYGLKSLSS